LKMRICAFVAIFVLVIVMFSPTLTRVDASPAFMNTLDCRWLDTQDALFAALLRPDSLGGIDSMQWPLTLSEYQTVLNNPAITVEPMPEAYEFEIAFNNNYTDGVAVNMAIAPRSVMNFTDFRNALNCLVNRAGVIAMPTLGGFATPCYTQVPTPLEEAYVNPAVSGANYPWMYNVTHALQILWTDGWYNHADYPTLTSLIEAYADGGVNDTLQLAMGVMGTGIDVVYSGNDPNGQWGGSDPQATVNSAVANTPIGMLQGYVRTIDARKDLGDQFTQACLSIGIPVNEYHIQPLGPLNIVVKTAQHYDFATLGYSFGVPPNWWYYECTPAGIYSNGPNPYLIDDANMTHYAYAAFTDPDPASFDNDQMQCQYILVMESYLVSGYCPAAYCAYKTGLLGQIDILGQGSTANGAQWENWITLGSRKSGALGNTINYEGPVSGTPDSNILYVGLLNPMDMINPIFQDEVFDFQISDEIFTYPLAANPYTIAVGGALTGFPQGGDLPWMAYAWTTSLINDPYNSSNPQWTNVTLYFRHDITWQDGTPFTVADMNYTIYINSLYGDSWTNYQMIFMANVSKPGTPDTHYEAQVGDPNYAAPYFQNDITPQDPTGNYTCSILVETPSWLNLYMPNYQIVPYHLYKYIVPTNMTAAELGISIDGLHGIWPGQIAVSGNILPGAPFTLSQVNNFPETTLVGTGPFKFRPGSLGNPVEIFPWGGPVLDEYSKFFMKVPLGAIAFQYTWSDNSPANQPSGGFYRVGLADLIYLANAYGTTGTPASAVSITGLPGSPHTWNPAADLAAPSGAIGLTDLVTLSTHYGWYYGNYSYNAPYPPSEVANGGP
jgi:hypothetical protein